MSGASDLEHLEHLDPGGDPFKDVEIGSNTERLFKRAIETKGNFSDAFDTAEEIFKGRDDTMPRVLKDLYRGGKILLLTGPVGVGKSSTANVAIVKTVRRTVADYHDRIGEGSHFIPLGRFHAQEGDDAKSLQRGFYELVLRNLTDNHVQCVCALRLEADAELPEVPASDDADMGLLQQRYERTMADFEDACPGVNFIVKIEDMESVHRAEVAQSFVDSVRFDANIPNLRLILVGARGVIDTVADNPKTANHVAKIGVSPLPPDEAEQSINFRLSEMGQDKLIEEVAFADLYRAHRCGMRESLKTAEEYKEERVTNPDASWESVLDYMINRGRVHRQKNRLSDAALNRLSSMLEHHPYITPHVRTAVLGITTEQATELLNARLVTRFPDPVVRTEWVYEATHNGLVVGHSWKVDAGV